MKILKKLSKNVVLSTAILATSASLAINYFLTGPIDFVSAILYVGLGLTMAYIFANDRFTAKKYAFLGAGISITYNLLGVLFGWFAASTQFMFFGAIQQAIIFYLVAKIEGVKG